MRISQGKCRRKYELLHQALSGGCCKPNLIKFWHRYSKSKRERFCFWNRL